VKSSGTRQLSGRGVARGHTWPLVLNQVARFLEEGATFRVLQRGVEEEGKRGVGMGEESPRGEGEGLWLVFDFLVREGEALFIKMTGRGSRPAFSLRRVCGTVLKEAKKLLFRKREEVGSLLWLQRHRRGELALSGRKEEGKLSPSGTEKSDNWEGRRTDS